MSETHVLKLYTTGHDIWQKLSERDKKRFNKVIITDVRMCDDFSAEITCIAVNDCPVESDEENGVQKRYNYDSTIVKPFVANILD